MGTNTDGLLFYGWCFPEGHEFPWSGMESVAYSGEETWWRKVNGYEPPFRMYDDHGDDVLGHEPSSAELRIYYDHQNAWDDVHPMPVSVVNYCYCDAPMWALIIPSSLIRAWRGDPKKLDLSALTVMVTDEDVVRVREFCAQYGIELPGDPAWYLASYWSN